MNLGHARKVAEKLSVAVRRKLPGTQTRIVAFNYDTMIGVGFFRGHQRHGVIIKPNCRKLPPKTADQIASVMRGIRRNTRALPRITRRVVRAKMASQGAAV